MGVSIYDGVSSITGVSGSSVGTAGVAAASSGSGGGAIPAVANYTYSGNTFDFSTQLGIGSAAAEFSADGLKFFAYSQSSGRVYEYNLSTAGDISTAVYSGTSYNIHAIATAGEGLSFSSDGTKLLYISYTADRVYQLALTAPYDISAPTLDGNFSVSSTDTIPRGVAYNADGTRIYMVGDANDYVAAYTLSTPYDLSTAALEGTSPVVTDFNLTDLILDANEQYVLILADGSNEVIQMNMSTTGDITTATELPARLDISGQTTSMYSSAQTKDGLNLVVIDQGSTIGHLYTRT